MGSDQFHVTADAEKLTGEPLERLAVGPEPPTPATLAFECHGARLGVTVPDQSLAENVARRLPPSAVILEPSDGGDLDENVTLTGGGTSTRHSTTSLCSCTSPSQYTPEVGSSCTPGSWRG